MGKAVQAHPHFVDNSNNTLNDRDDYGDNDEQISMRIKNNIATMIRRFPSIFPQGEWHPHP